MEKHPDNLIWIDLEMTGLDPERDRIIEIATIVTDAQLTTQVEGPVLAIHQDASILGQMDEWNQRTHGESGLLQRIKDDGVSETTAVELTLSFLEQYVERGKSPMCGNTICQDRRFLARYMPSLESFFHYRNLDVSTLKELARRWQPEVYSGFKKKNSHQALDDIRESIQELQYYREKLLK